MAEEIRHKGILPFDCVGQNASSEVHRATIRRGFEHYASRLNTRQKMLTGLVALFRTPVPEGLVALLGRHLLGKHESMEFVNEDCLRRELDLLCRTGVLIRQPDANKKSHVYACRPAFRVEMVQWVLHAYSCADPTVLANDAFHRSVSREPGSIVQLMHAVISCLLQSGDQGPGEYAQADGLFRHQLSDGRMFFKAHDLETGAACVLQFVRDEARQRACERLLPNGRLSHYLHLAGLFLLLNGHTEEAGAYHAAAACRVDSRDVKILLNHSLIYSLTGNPSSAERVAREAAKLSKGSRRSANYRHSLCCLAHSLSLQGSMREADALFCEAQQESTEEEADGSAQLHEADLVLWAWHLLRQGKAKRAKQVMEIELRRDPEFTNSGETGGLVPFLRWLTAEADFKLGMLDKSLEEAAEIERVLKGGSALLCLPLVLLTKAKCHLGLRQLQDAHHACWEALKMAAKRKLNMVHGAACALLASILLETGLGYVRRQEIATSNGRSEDRLELVKKTEGFDDGIELDESALPSLLSYPLGGVKVHADHALNLGWEYAEVCRDAYTVLAEAAEIKGELDKQKRYAAEAIICSERLRGEVETNLGALESDSAVSRK